MSRIARDAGFTTGAVYHHFSSRHWLFQALAERLEIGDSYRQTGVDAVDPWQRLRLGFEKLIDFCASAEQRIIFIEAPQVIAPAEWRQIELRYAFGALRRVLGALRDAGKIKRYPIDLLACFCLCCTSARLRWRARRATPEFAPELPILSPAYSTCWPFPEA